MRDDTPFVVAEIAPDDLVNGLNRVLKLAEVIANLTPNRYDDLAVATLKGLVNTPGLVEALLELFQAKGVGSLAP